MATQKPQPDNPTVGINVEKHGEIDVDVNIMSDAPSCKEVSTPLMIDDRRKEETQHQAWFENAIKDRLKIPNAYEEVSVLMVRWHPDIDHYSKGHDEEIKKLKQVFRRFGFSISPVVCLDTRDAKPQNTLNLAIAQHIAKHDGANKLMIIYYTGHGLQLGDQGRLAFAATPDAHKVSKGKHKAIAYWDTAEELLFKKGVEPDVLTILDCCFASRGHKGCDDSRRIYDLLAACDRDETTPAPCSNSFTARLITALEKFLNDPEDQNILTTKLLEEMNKGYDNPAYLYDRFEQNDNRHVQLKPMSKQAKKEAKQLAINFRNREPEGTGVHLRFSLQTKAMSKKRIEDWAQALVTACENVVALRRIDWVKMERNNPGQRLQRVVDKVHQNRKNPRQRFRRAIDAVIADNKTGTQKRNRSRETSPSTLKRQATNKVMAPRNISNPRLPTPESNQGS